MLMLNLLRKAAGWYFTESAKFYDDNLHSDMHHCF